MLGMLVAGSLQPFVQCHGRIQRVQALTSFSQFGKNGAAGAQVLGLGLPDCPAAAASFGGVLPISTAAGASFGARPRRQRHPAWRCLSAQELHVVDTSGSSGGVARRTLQPGDVHIWWLDPCKVSSRLELQRASQLLTAEELQECSSSGEVAVRRERLLARALVRSVLSGYLEEEVHPCSLLFGKNRFGKPHLLWPCKASGGSSGGGGNLRFNLTHTASMIGLAVTVDCLVGLDVEGVERRTRQDPMRLARRRFSDQEITDLQACPDEDSRAARFLQLWTLKEAYVKALGRGISAPPGLRSFSFRLGGQQQQQRERGGMQQPQQQQEWEAIQQQKDVLAPQQHVQHTSQQQRWQEQERGWQGQENIDANSSSASVPSLQKQSQAWRHGTVATSSCSGARGGTDQIIHFSTAAPDLRHWQFALLQPAQGHLAAVCIERHTMHHQDQQQQQHEQLHEQQQPLLQQPHQQQQQQQHVRVLNFEAALFGEERLFQPHMLAQGSFP